MNTKQQDSIISVTTTSLADVVEAGTLVMMDLMGGNTVARTVNSVPATRTLIAQMLSDDIVSRLGARNAN